MYVLIAKSWGDLVIAVVKFYDPFIDWQNIPLSCEPDFTIIPAPIINALFAKVIVNN